MPSPDDKRVALVLSAGGIFGAWQAGAWLELQALFQPDLVVGTSIGALNGWLIAGNCPPAELRRLWSDQEEFARHRFRIPPGPLEGFLDPARFERLVQELHAGWRPQLPMGVVLSELRTLQPRLFQGDEITWRHLAAACAVLGFFPAYRLDGRRHIDGGVLGALPLWAAGRMGARRVVALHVLPETPRIIRWPLKLLRGCIRGRPRSPSGVPVLVLSPEARLGGLRDVSCWRRENVERWLEAGAAHVRNRRDCIKRFLCDMF